MDGIAPPMFVMSAARRESTASSTARRSSIQASMLGSSLIGTGSELGAPALYIVSSDDRRYDGVARGAEPIPDGEQVTLEFTFPGTVGPETIGLAVLAFGEVNVGAMSPVPRAG